MHRLREKIRWAGGSSDPAIARIDPQPTTPTKLYSLTKETAATYLRMDRGEEKYRIGKAILKEGTLRAGAPDEGVELEPHHAPIRSRGIRGNLGALFAF